MPVLCHQADVLSEVAQRKYDEDLDIRLALFMNLNVGEVSSNHCLGRVILWGYLSVCPLLITAV